MNAARIHEWGGGLRFEETPRPQAGDGEVLVQVEACGVGLTVLNYMRGDLGTKPSNLPRVPGHELVGTIVEVGAGVSGDRRGERVIAYFYLFCGRCPHCLAGQESLCDNLAGFLGVDRDGGYAEFATLPSPNAIAIPRDIDPIAATVIPDAVATPVHVSIRSNIRPGDRVAVIAAGGGVGIHMGQVARLYDGDVVGLEVSAKKRAFLEAELGIPTIDSSDFGEIRLPSSWHQRADVIIDLLGSRASLSWSAGALATGGRLVLLTTFRDVEFSANPRALVLSQSAILGSRYAYRHEVGLAAAFVSSGKVRPIIGRQGPLAALESMHDELRNGTLLGRGALVWPATARR